MRKIFCKRNIFLALLFIFLTTVLLLCCFCGSTENVTNNFNLNAVVCCVVGIFSSIMLFSCITKILDKKTKKLFVALFCLFLFWLCLNLFRKIAYFNNNTDIFWYLLYVPILFIPTLWFLINNQIYLKSEKLKKVLGAFVCCISTLLLMFVLTNDLHQFVFLLHSDVEGTHTSAYTHNWGYYLIYAFIFIEILTTIILFYACSVNKANAKQKFLPSIVIVLLLVYSVVYLTTKITIPVLRDMSVVYVVLGSLLAFVLFRSGLIKNSGNYAEFFETCATPLAIFDQQNNAKYLNAKFCELKDDQDYIITKHPITNGVVLSKKDVGKFKKLQQELTTEIENLNYTNKILERKKEVLQNKKQIEQHNLLLSKVEKQTKSKRTQLDALLASLPNKINQKNKKSTHQTLNQIKLIVGYLKRKTSLILNAEQNNFVTKDELRLLFNESFNDLKAFGTNAGVGIAVDKIDTHIAIKFYDVYNELISLLNYKNVDMWLTINKRETWEMEITFDNANLGKIELKLPDEYKLSFSIKTAEDCTVVCFKEADK